jgi:hypothetical protein
VSNVTQPANHEVWIDLGIRWPLLILSLRLLNLVILLDTLEESDQWQIICIMCFMNSFDRKCFGKYGCNESVSC